jgi:Holliday junction resolvasome RuvABC endonuclease subunit
MVKNLLCLAETPKPDDAADALAIAITGLALSMYDLKNESGIPQ